MKPYQIIQLLAADNSRIVKEQIVARALEQGVSEFFHGARLALDPMITFGVKQVPERSGLQGNGYSWTAFANNVDRLIRREVTGHAARLLIEDMMQHSTNEQWNHWYRLILIKDLRCGVSEKTINKVVESRAPQFVIPIFSCQLAHDSGNHESKLAGRKLIETKLDGVRVLTIVYPDGRVDQFSRNGKELVNFEHIKQQFQKTVAGITEPVVFDGEVMSSSFQDLMKQVHRKSDVAAQDAVLHLFDFVPLKDFQLGYWDRPQLQRSEKLRQWKDLWEDETPNVRVLSYDFVDLDTEAGEQRFREINQAAIAGGYEGIMIKDLNAIYECKRTVSWLKLKPFIEVSLTVVNTEEGTGRNQGRLGALVCEGVDDGRQIRVNVGSGFSDQQRSDFWQCRTEGQVVEVRADAVTQNQDGSYSLRFPRFVRFRGFAAGEKM